MARFGFFEMLRVQRQPPAPVVKRDLTSKTVVVTGANVGLGLEAAKHFASMNPARLILACRNKEKGEAALEGNYQAIREATGYNNSELWLLDLARFASVIEFSERFERDGGKIDILVANAAVALYEYKTTPEGWEETIQINHLSTALLSVLLLPRLQQAAVDGSNPRLVIVSSSVHFWAPFGEDEAVISSSNIFEKLSDKDYCTEKVMGSRYYDSKLLNVLFARALTDHLPTDSPIIVSSVNPGYCVSELRRSQPFPMAQISALMDYVLAHTTEQGSRQLVWAALGGEGREDELRGAYISEANVTEPSDFVLGKDGELMQNRVWADTFEILSKVSPKFVQVVQELTNQT